LTVGGFRSHYAGRNFSAMEGEQMARQLLTDDEWESIADLFPEPAATGRPQRDRRTVFNAILWILRTGSPWRDLPEEFGPWQTAWRLFDQWNSNGTLDAAKARLQASLAEAHEIDNELWCVDGTVVRAARCAAGGGKKGIRRNRTIMR
jgi:transposase